MALLHGMLLCAGLGVLVLAGVPSPRWGGESVARAGLAYLCGVATVGTTMLALATVGGSLRLRMTLGIALLLSLPFARRMVTDAIRRRTNTVPSSTAERAAHRPRHSGEWRALVTVWLLAGAALGAGLVLVHSRPLVDWDTWAIWTLKAHFLFANNTLPTEFFTSQSSAFAHPDYPLLLPLIEAAHFRALGHVNTSEVHVVMWLLLTAWLGTMAFLARDMLRRNFSTPLLLAGGVLLVPPLLTGYADAPLAIFLSAGALSLGRWLSTSARSDLVVAVILLAGGAGMKNEGLLGAAALLVAAVSTLALRRATRRQRGALVAAAAVFLAVAVVPWRLWLGRHQITTDFALGDALNPGYLADHRSRVWPAFDGLLATVGELTTAAVFVAVATALILVLRSRAPGLTSFYGIASGIYFLALVWVYWISPFEVHWHISHSVTRVYLGLAMIGFAACLQLGGVASPPPERSSRGR